MRVKITVEVVDESDLDADGNPKFGMQRTHHLSTTAIEQGNIDLVATEASRIWKMLKMNPGVADRLEQGK